MSLIEAFHHPGALGEEIGAARRELAQLGDGSLVLSFGQVAPSGMTPRRTLQPCNQDPLSTGLGSLSHRHSRSNRLPECILRCAAEIGGTGQQQVNGHADKRVLRNPLPLSPALPIKQPAQPRELVELVGAQTQLLAFQSLPLGNLRVC
jgi:hypothetical protein